MKIRKPLPQVVSTIGTVWTRYNDGWSAAQGRRNLGDSVVQGWLDRGTVTVVYGWSSHCEVCGQPYSPPGNDFIARVGCKPDIAHPGHSYCANVKVTSGPTMVDGVRWATVPGTGRTITFPSVTIVPGAKP